MEITVDALEECKKVLEDLFLTDESIPLCSEDSGLSVGEKVITYLINENHGEWLYNDPDYGLCLGDVPLNTLGDFARNERVFDGVAGKFVIRKKSAVHSAPYFEAWISED